MNATKAENSTEPTCTPDKCLLIQWGQLFTINNKPACPRCHAPAEMVLGFFGNPCWAHEYKPNDETDAKA